MSSDHSSSSKDWTSYDYSASSGEEFDAVMDDVPNEVKISHNKPRGTTESPELLEHPSPSWKAQTEYQNLHLLESEVAKLHAQPVLPVRDATPRKISTSSTSDIDIESNEYEVVESESSDTATVIGSILSAWFLPALWVLAKIVDTVAIVLETGTRMIGWLISSDS